MDADLLGEAECFFGGGTAAALVLGEYRESVDIDFLCASQDGYRLLRQRVHHGGFDALLRVPGSLRTLRDLRADQYGLRTVVEVDGAPIKLEIVREGRIELRGALHGGLGVPVLLKGDMMCEKLLANADRYADAAVLSRDVIDLSVMIAAWGPVPEVVWDKARRAYGEAVDLAYAKAVARIRDPGWLARCMQAMSMDPDLAGSLLAVHGGPLPREDQPDERREDRHEVGQALQARPSTTSFSP